MNNKFGRRTHKRDFFILGTLAAFTLAPQAVAAEGGADATEVTTLRDQNAELQNRNAQLASQLAEMQKRLDRMAAQRRSGNNASMTTDGASGPANRKSSTDLVVIKGPRVETPRLPPTWTGLYLGVNLGGGWNANHGDDSIGPYYDPNFPISASNLFFLPGGADVTKNVGGVVGGGQIGYNYQVGPSWVIGAEADIQASSIGSHEPNYFSPWYPSPLTPGGYLSPLGYGNQGQTGFNVAATLPWFGTVRGRAGYLVTPTWLIYGTAGLAYGEVQGGYSGYSDTRVGWTAGAGVEWKFRENWSAKLEYLYLDLSGGGNSGYYAGLDYGYHLHPEVNIIRAGLNYQMNLAAIDESLGSAGIAPIDMRLHGSEPQDLEGDHMRAQDNYNFSRGLGRQVVSSADTLFHTHPEGVWMFSAQEMHSEKDGYQAGNSTVPNSQVGPAVFPGGLFGGSLMVPPGGGSPFPSKYPYMMWAPRMTMDMFMFMGMYGVTDRLTVMGMLNYQSMNMPMNMDMGNMPQPYFNMMGGGYHEISPQAPMVTAGLGDTQLYASYKIYDDRTYGNVTGTLGINLPTGSTTQAIPMMGYTYRAPYDMQLGSGTFDLKPALTYSWMSPDLLWNLGTQVSGNIPLATNNGWSYGNSFKISAWAQRALFGENLTAYTRWTFTDTGQIRGQDANISCLNFPCNPTYPWQWAPTPDADPRNYGGQVIMGFLGADYKYGKMSLGAEIGLPVYQYLNGLQLRNSWQVTTGVLARF
jgi:outer membrane immunogenic protein